MLYSTSMDTDRHIWQEWAEKLHHWGVDGWAASFLEAVGPLALLGAQLIYFTQPLLRPVVPDAQLQALADLLEQPERAQAFAAFLREDRAK